MCAGQNQRAREDSVRLARPGRIPGFFIRKKTLTWVRQSDVDCPHYSQSFSECMCSHGKFACMVFTVHPLGNASGYRFLSFAMAALLLNETTQIFGLPFKNARVVTVPMLLPHGQQTTSTTDVIGTSLRTCS